MFQQAMLAQPAELGKLSQVRSRSTAGLRTYHAQSLRQGLHIHTAHHLEWCTYRVWAVDEVRSFYYCTGFLLCLCQHLCSSCHYALRLLANNLKRRFFRKELCQELVNVCVL